MAPAPGCGAGRRPRRRARRPARSRRRSATRSRNSVRERRRWSWRCRRPPGSRRRRSRWRLEHVAQATRAVARRSSSSQPPTAPGTHGRQQAASRGPGRGRGRGSARCVAPAGAGPWPQTTMTWSRSALYSTHRHVAARAVEVRLDHLQDEARPPRRRRRRCRPAPACAMPAAEASQWVEDTMPKVPLSSGLVPDDGITVLRVRTVCTMYSLRLPESIAGSASPPDRCPGGAPAAGRRLRSPRRGGR